MARLWIGLLLALLLGTGPARAQVQAPAEPSIAPAPAWVEQIPAAAPVAAQNDRPVQVLLSTSQSLYGTEHIDHYAEVAFLIQNAQGLQGLGNVTLPWQPEQGELIIHKVRIIRGGTTIDLLADGQRFTVLRRENNLESAMLDGVLTAVMQPEGLAVGDVLNVAFTLRRRAGALPLRGENLFVLAPGAPIRRLFLRQIWPAGLPIRWRATGRFEQARTRSTRLGTELIVDLADAEGAQPPTQAPARFTFPAMLQLSQYRDWAEIGALVAPHYERAQALAADSPVRREIERIAALSPDPRVRTMAALRTVQERIRYFALVMGDGNYLPATAEQTWSRRFADCKGKVVLLLALLRGLGVEAEAALVNATAGDALDGRLPMLSAFNHLIVRVRIDGRSYWLDGTRTGDRNLEDLASSTLAWGLPIRAAGSELERIPYAPPSLPLTETNTVYDGSSGFAAPVPVRMEVIFRGDAATQMRQSLSQIGRDEFLRHFRDARTDLPGEEDEITGVDLRDDADRGSFAIIVSGRTRMSWTRAPGAASQRFRFDNGTIRWEADFDRQAGPFRDAPFAFDAPLFLASTETVILPNGGAGFSIDGRDLDEVVAGARISRRLAIADGRATARSEFRRVAREVAAAEARQGKTRIETIGNDQAWLRAPAGTAFGVPPPRPPSAQPAGAEALVNEGYAKMDAGRVRPALADFDRAIALAPEWSLAHADRGIALVHLGRLDEAETALATALRLEDTEFAAHQGLGYLRLRQGRPEEAIGPLTRSLELRPGNAFTLTFRAQAQEDLGRMEDALADLDRILAAEPRHAFAHSERARIFAHLGREADALAAIDRALEADPTSIPNATARGEILERFGRTEQAAAAWRAALAIVEARVAALPAEERASAMLELRMGLIARSGRPREAIAIADAQLRRYAGSVPMLASRCWIRLEANIELPQALRDCDEALRAEPGHPVASAGRARLYLRMARWADAIGEYDRLLASGARSEGNAYYGRAIARLNSGDRAGGEADLAAARRHRFDVAREYARMGIAPPAEPPPAATPN